MTFVGGLLVIFGTLFLFSADRLAPYAERRWQQVAPARSRLAVVTGYLWGFRVVGALFLVVGVLLIFSVSR